MSTGTGSGGTSELPTRSATVQASNGSVRVTIPADVASEIDFEAGDTVVMKPVREDELRVRKAELVWRSD